MTLNFKVVLGCITRCALCVALLALYTAAAHAAPGDEDRGKEFVERQQKIEIQRFQSSRGGRAPMTPMAIQLYNDAVKFFEKSEYELARQAIKESLSLEPRNALAWELLGEIEYLQQSFDKAQEYYKKSYLLSPSQRVRQKIEKSQKEQAVEKDLDTYNEEHFIIKYRQGEKGYDGFGLREMLRETYRMLSQDFGYYFNHKTVVLFYSGEEFRNVTGQSHWVGGLYDGKIRLPAFQQGFQEKDLRAAATHEMTHAFVASLSGLRAPAWIHEGLAQYEENKIRPINTVVFESAVKTGTLLPINQLLSDNVPLAQKDPLLVMLFYQQAFSLVDYMVERYQMYQMKELLVEFKDGKSAEEAIFKVFQVTPQQLEKEWLLSVPKS